MAISEKQQDSAHLISQSESAYSQPLTIIGAEASSAQNLKQT
jgi:hypothetical protein